MTEGGRQAEALPWKQHSERTGGKAAAAVAAAAAVPRSSADEVKGQNCGSVRLIPPRRSANADQRVFLAHGCFSHKSTGAEIDKCSVPSQTHGTNFGIQHEYQEYLWLTIKCKN